MRFLQALSGSPLSFFEKIEELSFDLFKIPFLKLDARNFFNHVIYCS